MAIIKLESTYSDGWKTTFKTRDDHSKLQQKKCGPYQIVKKINNNVYVVDLPSWMRISNTFNVANLTLFKPYMSLGYLEKNSRTSSSQVEVSDAGC